MVPGGVCKLQASDKSGRSRNPSIHYCQNGIKHTKPGFYSKNPDLAYWACKLFPKIAHDFQVLQLFNVNWDWFLAKDGGLDCIVYTITKHPHKIHTIFHVILNFAHNNLYTLLVQNVKLNYIDGNEYMGFVVRIIEPLF
jgi:hypothetical protein